MSYGPIFNLKNGECHQTQLYSEHWEKQTHQNLQNLVDSSNLAVKFRFRKNLFGFI